MKLKQSLKGAALLEQASAIIKDEARCIRCAQCADRCPVGAVTMERFSFEESYQLSSR